MNPDLAEVAGMLHDIGRRFPGTNIKHCLDGYNIMLEKGYPFIANICLSHAFQVRSLSSYAGKFDLTSEEESFIIKFLDSYEYSLYDLLIPLCDAFAGGSGYWLIEKRLVNVALRNGIAPETTLQWKKIFELKYQFEELIGCSVYDLLPGVVENTFDNDP